MYSAISAAVNFIGGRLCFRVPRLKASIFVEHLANLILLKFGEYQRFTITFSNNNISAVSSEVHIAANAVALSIEEIIACVGNIKLHITANEVLFADGGNVTPIWTSNTAPAEYQPGPIVPLSLVPSRELGVENPFPNNPSFVMFRYVIPSAPTFTVETFSQTRFGAIRKRPDPEAQRRIQKAIICNQQQQKPKLMAPFSNGGSGGLTSMSTTMSVGFAMAGFGSYHGRGLTLPSPPTSPPFGVVGGSPVSFGAARPPASPPFGVVGGPLMSPVQQLSAQMSTMMGSTMFSF